MVIWLILFFIVFSVSLFLAYRSIKDFQILPPYSVNTGLFLIKNTRGLTEEVLKGLFAGMVREGSTVSIERVFKGSESALLVFGRKSILMPYSSILDLLELEDYINIKGQMVFFEETMPPLAPNEQFWWQMVLFAELEESKFKVQIRTAITAQSDHKRREVVTQSFLRLFQSRAFLQNKNLPILTHAQVLAAILPLR